MEKNKKTKRILFNIIKAVVGLYLFYIITGSPVMLYIMLNTGHNYDSSNEAVAKQLMELHGYDVSEYISSYSVEEVVLTSSMEDSHKIYAYLTYADASENKDAPTVIMCHGVNSSHVSLYPVSEVFLKKGYNVLTYDQRSFGQSDCRYVTFGYFESNDLLDCLNYVNGNVSKDNKIGVWGQSMGGATVENAMDEEAFVNSVDFCILDCPLGAMSEVSHAGPVQNCFASMLCKLTMKFSFSQQSPYKQIENNHLPVLIITANQDKVIPSKSIEKINESLGKCLYMNYSKDAKHANVYFADPDGYSEMVDIFVGQVE